MSIDKTMLNLLSILVAGAGLFAILTKFDVPEVNSTFFGKNPFAIKRDIIESVMTWIFIVFTLIGLLIQTYSIIFSSEISERLYATAYYIKFFIIGLLAMVVIVFVLGQMGKFIAKKIWWPKTVEGQRESFESAQFIIEHDGWQKSQFVFKDQPEYSVSEESIEKNIETAAERLSQVEKLLEIRSKNRILKKRVEKLKPYFSQ